MCQGGCKRKMTMDDLRQVRVELRETPATKYIPTDSPYIMCSKLPAHWRCNKGFFAEQAKRAEREREEFDKQKKAIMSRISSCDSCWSSVQEWEANRSPARSPQEELGISDLITRLEEREAHVRAVELELAQTKLLLVEEQCRNQDLSHQMTTSMSANGAAGMESEGKKWLKKTMASLKDVRTSLKYNERTNSAVSVNDR